MFFDLGFFVLYLYILLFCSRKVSKNPGRRINFYPFQGLNLELNQALHNQTYSNQNTPNQIKLNQTKTNQC